MSRYKRPDIESRAAPLFTIADAIRPKPFRFIEILRDALVEISIAVPNSRGPTHDPADHLVTFK